MPKSGGLSIVATVDLSQIIEKNETLLAVLGIGSVVFFVGSLLAIPFVVAYLPPDFFMRESKSIEWTKPWSVIRKFVKNILGLIFLLAGFLMLFLPGQGLLSILLGISLLDFPAKRRWQLALVRRKKIHRSINWIRGKAHRPPIVVDKATHDC